MRAKPPVHSSVSAAINFLNSSGLLGEAAGSMPFCAILGFFNAALSD